jgi:RNA polymerase sigma-70 factor (ECF subfamily)
MNDRQPMEQGTEEFVRELTNQQTAMLAYIRSLMPGNSSARDVLQEVNVTLWQKKDQFTLGTNFKAWAFQTIRYHLMNHRRKMQSQGWLVFDDDLIEQASPLLQADADEIEERHQALNRCLQKLRPQDRALLQHRYASEASLRDYAVIVRKSEGTLKALLFNLRAVLRRCIEQQIKQSLPPLS